MQLRIKGFTIVELMVVIMIIGILAAIVAPLMKSRVDKAKWSEACAAAGIIRSAVRNYAGETNILTTKTLIGQNLGDTSVQDILCFKAEDLEGTYFSPSDYTISSINDNGIASIKVTGGSKDNSPTGSYIMQEDGKWINE